MDDGRLSPTVGGIDDDLHGEGLWNGELGPYQNNGKENRGF